MAEMTREEMLTAMDAICESFSFCTGDKVHGDCPFMNSYARCPIVSPENLSDSEVKRLYDIMVNKVVVKPTEEHTPPPMIVNNPVTYPAHYTQGKVQCIEAMESAFGNEAVATWAKLNAFKYIWRADHKNGLQDIDKAIWYLNKYKELKFNA